MKLANFLNLLDSENRLSITNVSVLIVLGKLIFIPEPSLTEVGMFLITMLNYSHKRFTINDNVKNNNDLSSQKESSS